MMKYSRTFHARAEEIISRIRSGEKFYTMDQVGKVLNVSANVANQVCCYSRDHKGSLGDAIAYKGNGSLMLVASSLTSPLSNAERREIVQGTVNHAADEMHDLAENEPDPYIKANYLVVEIVLRDAARKLA